MFGADVSQSIISYIKYIEDHLKKVIDDATVRNQYAWWLVQHATGLTKAELIISSPRLTAQQAERIAQSLQDMCVHHKPIAYVLGTVPFASLMLKVRPPILIPRPETEQWVYNLLMCIKESSNTSITILDLCTGSGCIGLLCAAMLPESVVYAVDISVDALQLATANKQLLDIKNIAFIQSNLFQELKGMKFDLILSNPPYIGVDEQLDVSVAAWEDPQALYASDDGYAIIQQIIAQAPCFLRANKQLRQHHINQLYIEIGWQQKDRVTKMMQKAGYVAITGIQDEAHKDRVVSGSITHEINTDEASRGMP